jgi:hypothetical protein
MVEEVDSNKEDEIGRLLKIRDNIPIHRDTNSVIYALLSQMNPHRYGNKTLMHTYNTYYIFKPSIKLVLLSFIKSL